MVVTGAGRGIGLALAQRFHRAGATVVLSDLAAPHEPVAALGERALAVAADVRTESGNASLIEAARLAFGPIDLFFANAGLGVGAGPIDTPEDDWNLAFDVNVHAHRWAAKHLLPEWLDRGSGYFCNTASAAGLLTQLGSLPYSMTKHAAVAFADWMSITYGDRGVRVSCLCPQGVNTTMLDAGDRAGVGIASSVVRASGVVLEPAEVAEITLQAIADEAFLILPHPEVAGFAQRRAADPQRWIGAMRRIQAKLLG